ncbi:MAG: hypothetical protein JNN03_07625 [Rubrivivax sp.]|nr:hypothetical protein [Rubrivivax sp.]
MNAITLDFSRAARKLHFNTGRCYTTHGQRLAVWVVPSVGEACCDAACFVDFDRDITGYFPIQLTGNFDTPAALARHVVHMVDHGQYRLGAFHGIHEHIRAVRVLGYEAFAAQCDAHEIYKADLAL